MSRDHAISGVDQIRPVVEAIKLGAAGLPLKPFEDSALQAAIENRLATPAISVQPHHGISVGATEKGFE